MAQAVKIIPVYPIHSLTHWGQVTHICVSDLTSIGSDNGLSHGRRQAIIRTNAGILLIRTLGTNFSEILSKINSFSFTKMYLKMSSTKWRLFRLGLNELKWLLMTWWHKEPGHQQSWYWPSSPRIFQFRHQKGQNDYEKCWIKVRLHTTKSQKELWNILCEYFQC